MTQTTRSLKLTLLLVSTLSVMAGATVAPALPLMAEVFADVPHSEFLSKLILTIPALFIALSGPFIGSLIDKFGRLKILMVSVGIYTIAGFSGFLLDDIYLILVGRALLGISVGGIMTTAVTLAGDYFEGKARQQFLGWQSGAMALGGTVFIGLGGILADISWRAPFLIYLSALGTLPLIILFLFEPENATEEQEGGTASASPPPTKYRPDFRVMLVIATVFLVMVLFYLVPTQLPFYLKTLGVEKNALAGLAILCITTTSGIVSLFYSRIGKWIKPAWTYVIGFVFLGLTYVGISQATEYYQVLVMLFVAGIGGGLFMPTSNAWLLHLAPKAFRGRVMGLNTLFLFLGQFLSPILAQPLAAESGLDGVYLFAGLLMLLAALAWVFYGFRFKTDVNPAS